MFDLVRPCVDCPFRAEGNFFGLRADRLEAIINGPAFQCHKTVDYDVEDGVRPGAGDRPQQCAGLMAVLHRAGRPNQIMRLARSLGHLDPDKLDPDGVAFETLDDAREQHARFA